MTEAAIDAEMVTTSPSTVTATLPSGFSTMSVCAGPMKLADTNSDNAAPSTHLRIVVMMTNPLHTWLINPDQLQLIDSSRPYGCPY